MIERPARRMLVLHVGTLGDCVLTLRWIDAVARAWTVDHVCLVARSPIAAWAARHGIIAEARSLESIGAHRLFAPTVASSGDLGRFVRGFDRVVSFLGGPAEPVSTTLAEISGDGFIAVDPQPTEATRRDGVHIVRQWLAAVGVGEQQRSVGQGVRVALTLDQRKVARETLLTRLRQLGSAGTLTALVHPGSGGLAKCCPIEAMEAVVEALAGRGFTAGWMIGPDEVERFGGASPSRLERVAPVVFEENIAAAADLLLGADVYVGNDAGMTHVAALCGARTIALFGPTDPRVWAPLGSRVAVGAFPAPGQALGSWISVLAGAAFPATP